MRVLIVRIGAMGDVLHAMPAVAAMRKLHPDWFIGWALDPRWSDLLQIAGDPDDLTLPWRGGTPKAMLDRWYSVNTTAWKRRPLSSLTLSEILGLREVFRRDKFDICVDMQGTIKSAVVGRLASTKIYAGMAQPREEIARKLYTRMVPVTGAHVVEQGCELLGAAIGEPLSPEPVTLPADEIHEQWADEGIGHEQFCLISPGGGWGAKLWPAERFGLVAAQLGRAGISTLVNSSPRGSREVDAVVAASQGHAYAVPCGIGQLISLVRRAAVVIAGDTGPLHLAAALRRPVVAIFGPTDPARNGPYGTRARILRDPESVTSHKRIPETEPGMLRITVDQVVNATLELLAKPD